MGNSLQSGMRLAAAGFEFATSIIVLAAIGYAVDRLIGWKIPIGLILGAGFGFAAGMYLLLRRILSASQSPRNRRAED
ncbi:MAG: AtpZ/AtpI family protein [Planctomycetota bacterium]